MDPLSCNWETASFLIFSGNVFAPLIYYSHLGPLIFSLVLGVSIIFNNPRALVNKILFAITALFSIWVYFDLVLWASENPSYIMFFWAAIVPIELLIYAACWYLVSVFANGGKEPAFHERLVAVATFIPIFLLAHTPYNLLGFDYTNCDREAIEGPLVQYLYAMEILFIAWIVGITIRGYRRMQSEAQRKQLLILAGGVVTFLLVFSAGNILVSYFLELDWSYEQYKLFGMPIFVAFITYSAIRFKTFDLKVITAQALVIALSVLVFSLLFVRTIENVRAITVVTFFLVCILGYILIRNVRKEIQQRQLIQKQEQELEVVNAQQENLLHFISHEIKGYLTKSQGGFAGIVEGDYGEVGPKLKEMATAALADVRKGVATVMDILDASNLKKGTMAFADKPFDLKQVVETSVRDLRPAAQEKNLSLNLQVIPANYALRGDEEKIRVHVVRNIIDNSIKYTPSGSVSVRLSREKDAFRILVEDTGVGITPEDKKHLFTEGGHGKDSIKVNVHSTGYGLYIAKQIVEAHDGKIWAESDGAGKGSRFIIELPAIS